VASDRKEQKIMEPIRSYNPAEVDRIVRQAERERARVLSTMILNAGVGVKTWFAGLFGAATPKTGRAA
jgi:hypothetical protein